MMDAALAMGDVERVHSGQHFDVYTRATARGMTVRRCWRRRPRGSMRAEAALALDLLDLRIHSFDELVGRIRGL